MSREGDTSWVVKIGSSLVTDNSRGLAYQRIDNWARQIVALTRRRIKVVLVSSGAVIEGMSRLGLTRRPKSVHRLQATAAVGQMGLIQAYEASFQKFDIHTAQVLLTHDDLRSRQRYLNARSTLRELLNAGVVPVVNENDTVATDEIRFGDNDTLAALVTNLIEAECLVLMTDQAGLYTKPPPREDAALVPEAAARDPGLDMMAGPGSSTGRGGMVTKINAARIAARSGANTIICQGVQANVLLSIASGDNPGTLLKADTGRLAARKQWLATLPAEGRVHLDSGASLVVAAGGKSLLPIGVTGTRGHYARGDMIACLDDSGREIARGLVNYDHKEVSSILGRPSHEIESVLGYMAEEELIHRDNLVLS